MEVRVSNTFFSVARGDAFVRWPLTYPPKSGIRVRGLLESRSWDLGNFLPFHSCRRPIFSGISPLDTLVERMSFPGTDFGLNLAIWHGFHIVERPTFGRNETYQHTDYVIVPWDAVLSFISTLIKGQVNWRTVLFTTNNYTLSLLVVQISPAQLHCTSVSVPRSTVCAQF